MTNGAPGIDYRESAAYHILGCDTGGQRVDAAHFSDYQLGLYGSLK